MNNGCGAPTSAPHTAHTPHARCLDVVAPAERTPLTRKHPAPRHTHPQTSKRTRWRVTLTVAITTALTACASSHNTTIHNTASSSSGGTPGSEVIESFDGHTLTRATLEHWIPIEAIIGQNLYQSVPPPPGMVPDPPHYTACINYERAVKPSATTLTTSYLKEACEKRLAHVREHMQQLLIDYQWMETEAERQHITITPQTLQKAYNLNKQTPAYRNATGETIPDELKIITFELQGQALQQKTLHEHGIAALRIFMHQYPRQLAAQTNCNPQYITPECKQYTGPEPPES